MGYLYVKDLWLLDKASTLWISIPGPINEMADIIDIAAQSDVSGEQALQKVGAKDVDVAIVTLGKEIENSILSTSIWWIGKFH